MTHYTRREFAKLALSSLPATGMLTLLNSADAAEKPAKSRGKPNSKVAGVVIGLNVPYSFRTPGMTGAEILANCVQLGLSGVELRTQPVELFLGAPANLVGAKNAVTGANAEGNASQIRKWRSTVSMDRAREFRRMYEAAGVAIEIVKVDGIFKMSDEELDYVFKLGQTLGARALSAEIAKSDEDLRRVGSFADKHKLMIGLHGHASTGTAHWEKAFSLAKYNGANLDIGHFVAGNHESPVEFLKKHHARTTHIHVKDRKKNNGPAGPFGTGDTPIVEVLQLIRDNRWNIQATIEFEYAVPEGSDRMKELAKCVQYCRDALARNAR